MSNIFCPLDPHFQSDRSPQQDLISCVQFNRSTQGIAVDRCTERRSQVIDHPNPIHQCQTNVVTGKMRVGNREVIGRFAADKDFLAFKNKAITVRLNQHPFFHFFTSSACLMNLCTDTAAYPV